MTIARTTITGLAIKSTTNATKRSKRRFIDWHGPQLKCELAEALTSRASYTVLPLPNPSAAAPAALLGRTHLYMQAAASEQMVMETQLAGFG